MSRRTLLRWLAWLTLLVLGAGCAQTPVAPAETAVTAPSTTVAPSSTVAPAPSATPRPTATPTPAPPTRTPPERPLLMVHTMPWYQTPDVSGFWGWHWTMEHFSPCTTDADGRPEIASHTMPVTGPYDSRDPDILEYQTLLMKISGIDGVIVDWYGIEDFWDYGDINRATQALFDAVDKAGLHFAICYEDQTVRFMVENDHLSAGEVYDHGQDVMRYLADTWFTRSSYLTFGERPVLLTFGPQYFVNPADWARLTSVLDTPPALVTLDSHTESAGVGSFPWPPMHASRDGVLTEEALVRYLEGFYEKAARYDYLVAGAFPGFHDIYAEAGVGESYGYLDARDGETFRLTLDLALAQQPDVIQLITWNDYGEGTTIEPTEEYGTRYLEMVQQVRRETDSDAFPFEPAHLALPLQILESRRQYPEDEAINVRLDEAFDAIIAGTPEAAAAILADVAPIP